MTSRWRFMTSSYLRTFLRISKLRPSIWLWALAIAWVTIFASIGTSSGILAAFRNVSTRPELNSRMRSSVRDR